MHVLQPFVDAFHFVDWELKQFQFRRSVARRVEFGMGRRGGDGKRDGGGFNLDRTGVTVETWVAGNGWTWEKVKPGNVGWFFASPQSGEKVPHGFNVLQQHLVSCFPIISTSKPSDYEICSIRQIIKKIDAWVISHSITLATRFNSGNRRTPVDPTGLNSRSASTAHPSPTLFPFNSTSPRHNGGPPTPHPSPLRNLQ